MCRISGGHGRVAAPLSAPLPALVGETFSGSFPRSLRGFPRPSLFFSFPFSFLANFSPIFKENGETRSKGAGGGGSEWESRRNGETYLVPELLCVVASGAKKLEFVSGEKSALSETHWLPEKLHAATLKIV